MLLKWRRNGAAQHAQAAMASIRRQQPATPSSTCAMSSKVYGHRPAPFTALRGIDPGRGYAANSWPWSANRAAASRRPINMFTGIDHPTDGEVIVADTPIRHLNEDGWPEWRGRTMGIIFQFFQLLPTLSVVENVADPNGPGGRYGLGETCRARHATCWSKWAWPTAPGSSTLSTGRRPAP